MATLTAAVVLAWIVLVVLAFAMAGLLHQLRDLQAALRRQGAGGAPAVAARAALPADIPPQDGKVASAVLLVDDHCPICAEVAPVFADLARARNTEIDFVVLASSANSDKWSALHGVRQVSNGDAYHLLDPGWRPAIVVIGPRGAVLATEPAGSQEAVRSVIANITTAGVAAG